ncbi:MAG: hypothetical protein ACM31G_12055 [Flavobacteriales bacterium]
MKILLPCIILIFSILFFSIDQNEAVIQFENKLEEHFKSYANNPREGVTKLGGGWVKEKHSVEDKYSYDVQETNSLVSPYKGICEFIVVRSYSDFHKTKEEAESDNEFIKFDKNTHLHKYLYQKGKWVVSERQNKSDYSRWYDCNEIIMEGENKNSTDIHGCWENNFQN